MKTLLIIPFALTLAACQTTGTAQQQAAVIRTAADNATAQAAATLKENCFLLQTGVAVAQLFVKDGKITRALNTAGVVLDSVCSGPTPQDIPAALLAVANAYRAVLNATPKAPA